MRGPAFVLLIALSARPGLAATARLTLDPTKARIGDPIKATLTVELGAGETIDASPLPVEWGPAQVLSGAWDPAAPGSSARTWSGSIAVYQLGSVTVPAVDVPVVKDGVSAGCSSEPVALTIEGTLPAGESGAKPPDLMDLKPEASIPPEYGPLKLALSAFLALLVAAGVGWWLWRRYAARLAAVKAPADPFRRLPPHVWVYEELEKLLSRRLAEEGRIGLFYDELTHIVKQYLEGRYRVDLLERTTSEVPAELQSAGAPSEAGTLVRGLLDAGDRVKFARLGAGPAECKAAIEQAYRLVDLTKPVEAPVEADTAAAS